MGYFSAPDFQEHDAYHMMALAEMRHPAIPFGKISLAVVRNVAASEFELDVPGLIYHNGVPEFRYLSVAAVWLAQWILLIDAAFGETFEYQFRVLPFPGKAIFLHYRPDIVHVHGITCFTWV
jgi:hypothetical protein